MEPQKYVYVLIQTFPWIHPNQQIILSAFVEKAEAQKRLDELELALFRFKKEADAWWHKPNGKTAPESVLMHVDVSNVDRVAYAIEEVSLF
jgi:hypothetical protein